MADQDDTLTSYGITMVLDDCLKEFDKGVGRICVPALGRELGAATARQVDSQTCGDWGQACKQAIKLRDRAPEAVNKHQEWHRGRRCGEIIGLLMPPVKDAQTRVRGSRGGVRFDS